MLLNVAFWYEFRRRADALILLALINPPVLLLYALTSDGPRPVIEIWLLGLGVTFLLCLTYAFVIYLTTNRAIRRGIRFVRREKFLTDLANRGPRMRKVEPRLQPRIEPRLETSAKAG